MHNANACKHQSRVRGTFDCVLSRSNGQGSAYSAKLSASVCEACGHVEFHAAAHNDLCHWLVLGRTSIPKAKSA